MSQSGPQGCLLVILKLFGIRVSGAAKRVDLPYRLRDDFLSPAELSFFRVLEGALAGQAKICPKVRLGDLFFVARPNENQGYRNKIDRKHVDFLICDPTSLKPLCGVELDDSSHARRDRQERDALVDQVFRAAGLPLVRFPAKRSYRPGELLARVDPYLQTEPALVPATIVPPATGTPTCPKCGVPMVKRQATQGRNAGRPFYGCPNFPRCRQVVNDLL